MTNFTALVLVTLATNFSEALVALSPAGDSKVVMAVTEQIYRVQWTEGTNTFSKELQRVPVATNFSVRVQEWKDVPLKIERIPLGRADKVAPPKL